MTAPGRARTSAGRAGRRRHGGCPPKLHGRVVAERRLDTRARAIRIKRLSVDSRAQGREDVRALRRLRVADGQGQGQGGACSTSSSAAGARRQHGRGQGHDAPEGSGSYRFGATGSYFKWPMASAAGRAAAAA